MPRSSNKEDPENSIEATVEGAIMGEGFQLGWGGMASLLEVQRVEKEKAAELNGQ